MPKTASLSLGLSNEINDNCDLLRHILLIFDFICISKKKHVEVIDILTVNLMKVKKNQISLVSKNETEA